MQKFFQLLFIPVAILTLLEYCYIAGLFTGVFMLILVCITGLVNIILSLTEHHWNEAWLYFFSTLVLCVGYLSLM